jgi:hypothetical protein
VLTTKLSIHNKSSHYCCHYPVWLSMRRRVKQLTRIVQLNAARSEAIRRKARTQEVRTDSTDGNDDGDDKGEWGGSGCDEPGNNGSFVAWHVRPLLQRSFVEG